MPCPPNAVCCQLEIDREETDGLVRTIWSMNSGQRLAEELASDLRRSNYRWVRLTTAHHLGIETGTQLGSKRGRS